MAESRSYAPPPLCTETTVDAVADSEGVPVNARLRRHLLLCQASSQQPKQRMTSTVFLDALARYPLPVVSAATARDVAGWERQWQLHQQSICSPSRAPSEVSGEPAPAAPRFSVRSRRSTVTLRDEGRMSFSDPSQPAAAELTGAIHQFWALSSASASSAPPHTPLLATVEEDSQLFSRTAAVSGRRSAPPPPLWESFSPFRFCADPSFHAALQRLTGRSNRTDNAHQLSGRVAPHSRRSCHMADPSSFSFPAGGCTLPVPPTAEGPHDTPRSVAASAPDGISTSSGATLGAPWTALDALCHGFAAASDGGCGRKRGRTATTAAASLANAEPTASARSRFMGTCGTGRSALSSKYSSPPAVATGAAQGTLRTNPSPDSIAPLLPSASPAALHEAADALQSRLAENDDLLDLLLSAEQSASRPPEFAGGLPGAQARLAGASGKADAQPSRKRGDEQAALPEHDCAATASRAGAGSRPGVLAVRADVDTSPASPALSSWPTPASSSTALASTALMRSGPVVGVGAEAGSSCGAGDGNSGEQTLPSTVKDLRDTCARLGLLSTGSKATLQRRLRLHYASASPLQHSGVCVPPVAAAATVSFSPPVPLDSGAMRPGSGAGASRPAGSPPRTVFRYRSPSPLSGPVSLASAAAVAAGQPHICTMEAVSGPTVRTGADSGWEQAAASAPPAGAAAGQRGRLVPSPTQFLDELASRKPQTLTALATLCDSQAPSSATAMRARQEELTSEMGRVRWQWLVDFRERASAHRGGGGRRQHEGMLEAFRKQHVPCTSVMLPAGDFMLSVELSPEEAATMDVCGVAAKKEAGGGVPGASSTAEGAAPVFSHLCSLVVERKTVADLDASVKGARYAEQRRLLAASPFRLVVWLVEGTDVAGGCGSGFLRGRQGGGGAAEGDMLPSSRSPSPASSSPAESARQRVDSACASLGLQGTGWMVVRTRSTAESVQFLKLLATHVTRQLASHRLRRRCSGEGESDVLVDTDCCVASLVATQHLSAQHHVCTGGGDTCLGSCGYRSPVEYASTARVSAAEALLKLIPTDPCLQSVSALQRHLRAKTAFPRMLMCVRGCSAALASLISSKYGTLLQFWRELRQRGQEACDADPDIQRLSTAQKKVYVLLTEFLLAKEYF
ncbi:hypothetical protein GH5_04911 [Leishmania sp. Ghana 2012 LV757]|uniref:hypothetical protein n=1 Tax=Leishmania sp. Ghana 2012 LV757 TaxID=2803181 RepID=UPI001B41FE7A|nr:hypothetical protein GH5_04911 [Leishmania sp. Ghana 2012 LV757]